MVEFVECTHNDTQVLVNLLQVIKIERDPSNAAVAIIHFREANGLVTSLNAVHSFNRLFKCVHVVGETFG